MKCLPLIVGKNTHYSSLFNIDLNIDFPVKNYNINLYLTDLGFITWNISSIRQATDSNFVFQGIEIDNILDFNDSIIKENNLIDDINRTQKQSFKSYIPANFGFSISHSIDFIYKHDLSFNYFNSKKKDKLFYERIIDENYVSPKSSNSNSCCNLIAKSQISGGVG